MRKPVLFAQESKLLNAVVLVVVADVSASIKIWRQYGKEPAEEVIGTDNLSMNGRPERLVVDYVVPQGYEITYRVEATDQYQTTTLFSDPVAVGPCDFGRDWLIDMADPRRSVLVWVESFNQYKYGVSRDVQRVWGRPDPVVVSGDREFPSGSLNLLTLELSERDDLLTLLKFSPIVAFAPQRPVYGLPGISYFSVGDVTESRVIDRARETARRWSLDVQQVAPPTVDFDFPDYGITWEQFATEEWSVRSRDLWWEALA